MRSTRARASLFYAGLLLAGAPLAAQQGEHPHQPRDTTRTGEMAQMMGMMSTCPMMSVMGRGPAAALRARDTLHLSAAQVTQLQALKRRQDEMHRQAMDSMRVIHRQLGALADAPRFDENATRAAFDRMGRVHTNMGVAMLRAQHEVAGVLTPAQRNSLAALGRSHMRTTGMMGGGGPAGDACGMVMGPGGPTPKRPGAGRDSAHSHEHGADTTGARQ